MALTEFDALSVYAKMLNTLDPDIIEPILADDFTYESQHVLSAFESKEAFLDYIRRKLQTIGNSGATVFAEMGMVSAYGKHQPCVVLAQNEKENLVGLVLARVNGSKLMRLDLCIVPPPQSAERSGDYPS
ncbi:MAG: hypothetical protein GY880_19310 [Planctomycetaceae bacterium]|nr:hypothetical protein [Planctomycetaceae bacterium]